MSATIAAIPVTSAAPALAPATVPPAVGVSSPQDLEQLRAMIAQGPSIANPVQAPAAPAAASKVDGTDGVRSLGDSILDGVAKFNSGYDDSMKVIERRLERIADSGPLNLGTDYGEVIGLQIEVARWSMSVMGVDNAAKAGTNTIKELSRGG